MKNRRNTLNRKRQPPAAATLDGVSYVGSSTRSSENRVRDVPKITLCGNWLKALGFPIGAPIYVFAEAHGRMAICRMGLHKPRWLHIVAPRSDKSAR